MEEKIHKVWNTHHSKHTKKKILARKNQWIPKVQVTSYFIYNLPDEVNAHSLHEIFSPFGDLFNTFIPDKRDKYGNRFGFVRYKNISDKLTFEKTLKDVKIGGAVLGVNLSRHDRMLLQTPPEKATSKPHITEPKQHNTTSTNQTPSHNHENTCHHPINPKFPADSFRGCSLQSNQL